MKITYILKDFTPAFYEGLLPSIVGFNTLSDSDKFKQLERMRGEQRVSCKVGNCDSFRDKVELNSTLKGPHSIQFKLEPRKGYKLATFEIVRQKATGECALCGSPARFRYGTLDEGIQTRPNMQRRVFCGRSCERSFNL